MIRFQCPHCDAVLRSAPDLAGSAVACGRCKARLRVPTPPAEPPARRSWLTTPLPWWLVPAIALPVFLASAIGYHLLVGRYKHKPPSAGPTLLHMPREEPPDEPPGTPSPIEQALSALNAERTKAGVPPLTLDPATKAGESAVVGKPPPEAIAALLAGPLHRDLLLARGRKTLGLSSADGVTVIAGLFDDQLALGSAPATLYPAPGQAAVPLHFPGNEVPDPLPDVTDKLAGYPVTVTFPRRARVTAAEAVMEDEDAAAVPCHVSTPEKPANKAFAVNQQNTVCLFPHAPLGPGRRYLVRVRARVEGRPWARLWAFRTRPKEEGVPRRVEAALKRLNAFRAAAGLPAVRADTASGKACQAHAEYLARHLDRVPDLNAAEERDDLDGYTEEGAAIAARSVPRLGGGGGPADAVDWLFASVLNRHFVLDPGLSGVGLGAAPHAPRGWVWVLHFPDPRPRPGAPVLFPGADQKDVPLFFPRDVHGLVPDAPKDARSGFAVTAAFPLRTRLRDVSATLEDAEGNDVPAWLSTPEKPLKGVGPFAQVVILPKAPLDPGATYRARVSVSADGTPVSRDWRFTTLDPAAEDGPTAERLVTQLNAARKKAGLSDVTLDEGLSKGCRLHAEYLVRNLDDPKTRGLGIHDEDKSLPGYTDAGAKAGGASVIAVVSDAGESVEMWMATLYHRIPLLDPGLKRFGYGQRPHPTRGWVTVLDTSGR